MSWASRRKTIYISIFGIFILLMLFLLFYLFIYKEATCYDGKKNQDEQEIDCGGSCNSVCDFETINPIVLWNRIFKSADGIYNVIALVENPNSETEAFDTLYVFRVYDDENILIYERKGRTHILSHSIFPIFEDMIITGERIPNRVFFEFLEDPKWVKANKETLMISIENKTLSGWDKFPRLNAKIKNETVKTLKNIEVVAILYDNRDNAIDASRTLISSLASNDSEDIVFTWSEPFKKNPVRIDIIPIIK